MRFKSEIPVRAMIGWLLVVMLNACDAPQEKAALPPPFAADRGGSTAMAEASQPMAAVLTFPQNTMVSASANGHDATPHDTYALKTGMAPQDLAPADLLSPGLQVRSAAILPPGVPRIAPQAEPVTVASAPSSVSGQNGMATIVPATLIEGPAPAAPARRLPSAVMAAAPTRALSKSGRADLMVTSSMPAAGTAVHLASYRAIDQARRGWSILSAAHAELASLTPLYVPVELPGKGHFLRLYGRSDNPAILAGICHDLQKAGAYCAFIGGQ